MVGLSQSAPAVGWGSPLHAWQASVNWIGWARYLNRVYRYGPRGMHCHILLRQYSQNYYTYNSVVKNTYSPCHKDAWVQISIGNTEWLLRYKGVSYTCFSGEKACFHRERWFGETPLGPGSRSRICVTRPQWDDLHLTPSHAHWIECKNIWEKDVSFFVEWFFDEFHGYKDSISVIYAVSTSNVNGVCISFIHRHPLDYRYTCTPRGTTG